MNITYLISTHNESRTLENLLTRVVNYKTQDDEIIVLDDYSTNPETLKIFKHFPVKVTQDRLDNDFGRHKNVGLLVASGEWVFQIDGDELPSCALLRSVKNIIKENDVEALYVPRINDFIGVTEEHARHWGWTLSFSPTYQRPIVMWPDHQLRLFKNDYPRIKFKGRLHEVIEGYTSYGFLPPDETLALYHDKSIEQQVSTNLMYNEKFTAEENQGHLVQ